VEELNELVHCYHYPLLLARFWAGRGAVRRRLQGGRADRRWGTPTSAKSR